jgi:putative aldouronate transport system permease protein
MDRNGSPSRANTKRRAGEQYTPMRASFFTRFYRYMKKYWFLYMLVLPGLCFLLVFEYAPMYGITLAFKDYSPRLGVLGSPWVGLNHFKEMLADPNFIRAFKNTLIINVYNLVFGFTFSVFLSLMINEIRLKKVKSVVQTSVYLPYFLSWVIFAGLVQVFLEYPSSADLGGVVNQVITKLGGTPIDFLKRPELFRGILVISNIIKTSGYSTIVYLAALAGISPTLYESAAIDGANRKDMLLHITIPRIMPSIAIMLILQLAGLFVSNFDQVYNLYNNYVLSTGDVLSTYIYRISLGGGGTNFELSTATNFLLNAMGLIVVVIANKFVNKLDVQGIF